MIELELQFIQNLQDLFPFISLMMKFISLLGTFEFMMFFIPFLYWLVDRQLGMRMIFLLLLVDTMTGYLKHLFHQPRPYWLNPNLQLAEEISYGIPSGHSSNAIAFWGYLIYTIRKPWMWILGILIILSIGFSRIYLGVHFPRDVLVGWILGLMLLIAFIYLEKPVSQIWLRLSDQHQIIVGFLISLLVIGIGFVILEIIENSPDPDDWAFFSIEARLPNNYVNYGGVFFGTILGILCVKKYANFQTDGLWLTKILRYIIGLIGVGLFFFGLDIIFGLIAEDVSILGYILRYVRYAIAAFWIIFIAPWIFIKLKLAKESDMK